MNNFFKKLNFIKRKDKARAPDDISKSINPHKHWKILLWAFSSTAICLIIFSLYLLLEIKNDQIFQIKQTQGGTPTLLKDDLQKSVTDSFKQKSNTARDITAGSLSFPDPSR
jgi:hypothetical protein